MNCKIVLNYGSFHRVCPAVGREAETGTLLKADINSLRKNVTFPYRVLDRLGARKMVNPRHNRR